MKRNRRINIILNIIVVLVLIITLLPFFIMLTTALKTAKGSVAFPPQIIPSPITFDNFKDILDARIFPFWKYFSNSFFIAFLTAAITVVIASLGAYSLARLEFKGKKKILDGTLVVYMFSGLLLVVPLYKIFNSIGIVNNRISVVIACLVSCLPAALFMLNGYFKSIPKSIEESAMIDGLNRVQVIFKMVIPLSIPAIMSVFAYVFMIGWNEFLFSTTFLNDPDKMPLTVGLTQLFSSKDYVWGRMMAASLLTAIPVVIIFSLAEKFITGGLTSGGVKE